MTDSPFDDPDLADLLAQPQAAPKAPVAQPLVTEPLTQVPVAVIPPAPVRPAPEAELSAEQKEIRDLKHQLALANTRKIESVEPTEVVAVGPDKIVIHIVRDGFTFGGKIWYAGQEVAFDRDSQPFNDTKDRYGYSWLDMDDSAQLDRYGQVYFRHGPWPGKRYEDPTAEAKERQRSMAAPALPKL